VTPKTPNFTAYGFLGNTVPGLAAIALLSICEFAHANDKEVAIRISVPYYTLDKLIDLSDSGVQGKWINCKMAVPARRSPEEIVEAAKNHEKKFTAPKPKLTYDGKTVEVDYKIPLGGPERIVDGKILHDGPYGFLSPLNNRGSEMRLIGVKSESGIDHSTLLRLPDGLDLTSAQIAEIVKNRSGYGNVIGNLNASLSDKPEVAIPGWLGLIREKEIGAEVLEALWRRSAPAIRPLVIGFCVSYKSELKKEIVCEFAKFIVKDANENEIDEVIKNLLAHRNFAPLRSTSIHWQSVEKSKACLSVVQQYGVSSSWLMKFIKSTYPKDPKDPNNSSEPRE